MKKKRDIHAPSSSPVVPLQGIESYILCICFIDSRRAACQRETELLDSADQCKGVFEDQVASLQKHLASLEHDLSLTKEDLRESHQQLRTKVCRYAGVQHEEVYTTAIS